MGVRGGGKDIFNWKERCDETDRQTDRSKKRHW